MKRIFRKELKMEYVVVGFLVGGFMGMIKSFSMLSEIYDPVFNGWKHIGVILFALFMIVAWWGGLIWLIVKYSVLH